ncbi:MAG TPA: hypothetical protein VFM14_19490 [Gemmatimonadales bacterium]|nr:hypothetical protein [Gemmatimonadales bacterium]
MMYAPDSASARADGGFAPTVHPAYPCTDLISSGALVSDDAIPTARDRKLRLGFIAAALVAAAVLGYLPVETTRGPAAASAAVALGFNRRMAQLTSREGIEEWSAGRRTAVALPTRRRSTATCRSWSAT